MNGGSPGNIRELQNVVERSLIVSESALLTIDERWLSPETRPLEPGGQGFSHALTTAESADRDGSRRDEGSGLPASPVPPPSSG
jgi:transcriptional regulator with AAA-type ATPase domain